MQIDSRNFQQEIDRIMMEIQTAHFIAFDCQFTGLVTQTTNIEGLYPDYQQFYERIKETALNFSILQLGITLFHYQDGEYYPKAYNFYVSGQNREGFNKVFVSEWDSCCFLARNRMNFSDVFQNGIKYKRIGGKEVKQPNFNPLQDKQYNSKLFFSPKDQEVINGIEKLVPTEKPIQINFTTKRIFDYLREKYEISYEKGKKKLERYEYICKVYAREGEFFNEGTEDLDAYMDVCKKVEDVNLEDKMIDQNHHKERTLETVVEKIIQCGKTVVGHFPNLDIGLIYNAFIGDLPEKYEDFAMKITELFPYFFDTKIISRRLQTRIKSIKVDLGSLYKSIFKQKGLEPYANINFKYVEEYLKNENSHDAGYDSYMTGCAFIAMMNFLYEVKKEAFVFSLAHDLNFFIYSRFSGEISLIGPEYTPRTREYQRRVALFGGDRKSHDWQDIGKVLSQFGTLNVAEDHGETYYVFDDEVEMGKVLQTVPKLKGYLQRKIMRARRMFG